MISLVVGECLKQLASDPDADKHQIPLVVQKHAVSTRVKGHLSNERRFYREHRDWIGEYETPSTTFTINLRNWRRRLVVEGQKDKPLRCGFAVRISETLKVPAAWAYTQGLRLHFEWVWDGGTVYIVQADQERELVGENPIVTYKSHPRGASGFQPTCLGGATESHAKRYAKIRNVFLYGGLGLPTRQLYVLDDQSVIERLASGEVSRELTADLAELVKGSLIIRMDIATEDITTRQMLPRTEEVRQLEKALHWLTERSAEFKGRGGNHDIVFIFHNFIPAESAAFAYASPHERKVQIEALWGLPEGIYYNAHDKYVVDTLIPGGKTIAQSDVSGFVVQAKANYKKFFVAPDASGHWTTRILKAPYDWKLSVRKPEWVKEIALQSRRIAEEEGRPISIMWFIGVSEEIPVLPWYHEPYPTETAARARAVRKKKILDKSLVIRTAQDIEVLRREARSGKSSSVRRIRIQPQEETLLRDKDTLRVIGELAKSLNAIILLEGGILSHAYYQLLNTNAIVEVLNPFDDSDERSEFHKLVRDKIPANIRARGESVRETTLSGEFLLRALREKLIEEGLEVLDARDQDSIVGELADVSEVVDAILQLLNVSREDMRARQRQKRDKAGGLWEGRVLVETRNPLPTDKNTSTNMQLFSDSENETSFSIENREVLELAHNIERWANRREHLAGTEQILHIVVPIMRDRWSDSTFELTIEPSVVNKIGVKISGQRSGSQLHFELSVSNREQSKLF